MLHTPMIYSLERAPTSNMSIIFKENAIIIRTNSIYELLVSSNRVN
jgi:hypothetical protein